MDAFSTEGVTALALYTVLSLLIIISIFIIGRFNVKTELFIKKMLPNFKIAVVITLIYFFCNNIGTGLNLVSVVWSVGLFCQSIVAITIASNLGDYKPLPLISSIKHNSQTLSLLIMLGIAILASILMMATSSLSMGIGQMLGETSKVYETINILPVNKVNTFFALLAGAGILEGVTYRLLLLSLLLKTTNKRWLAILLSASIFAIYHFTPLNVFYKVYWQIPVTQFMNVLLGGTITGYIYVKRGFETSVLAHTLADWLPLLLFM